MDALAQAARSATPPLTQAEQTKLITWIVKYRYGGQQVFFDPDIVAYAPALSPKSIAQYRDAIAANGGEPDNAMLAARLVSDLEEAGLHEDAVAYARLGVSMDGRGWDRTLITFLVEDAFARGAHAEGRPGRSRWTIGICSRARAPG